MGIPSADPELLLTLPSRPAHQHIRTHLPLPTLIRGHHLLVSPRLTQRLTADLMTPQPRAKISMRPPPLPMPIRPPHRPLPMQRPNSPDLLLTRQRPLVDSRKPPPLGVEMRDLDMRKAHQVHRGRNVWISLATAFQVKLWMWKVKQDLYVTNEGLSRNPHRVPRVR